MIRDNSGKDNYLGMKPGTKISSRRTEQRRPIQNDDEDAHMHSICKSVLQVDAKSCSMSRFHCAQDNTATIADYVSA